MKNFRKSNISWYGNYSSGQAQQRFLTDNNQSWDPGGPKKGMQVGREECAEAGLGQLVVSFFDHEPVNEFCSFGAPGGGPRAVDIQVPAKELHVPSKWIVLPHNLQQKEELVEASVIQKYQFSSTIREDKSIDH